LLTFDEVDTLLYGP